MLVLVMRYYSPSYVSPSYEIVSPSYEISC